MRRWLRKLNSVTGTLGLAVPARGPSLVTLATVPRPAYHLPPSLDPGSIPVICHCSKMRWNELSFDDPRKSIALKINSDFSLHPQSLI